MKKETNLSQKDLELIERIVYKNADDIAISIARSFERLEDSLNMVEKHIMDKLDK